MGRSGKEMVRSAFPDFHYTVEEIVAEGDKVAARLTAEATHRGQFLDIAPTGKHARWTEIHEGRMVQGKVSEHWAVIDQLGMLQQLGVIRQPGQQRAA